MKIILLFKFLLHRILPLQVLVLLLPLRVFSQDPLTGSGNVEELVLTVSDLTDEGGF